MYKRQINADVAEVLNISQEHPVSANLFAYCKNNPVNMVDQSGTIAANVIGAVIGDVYKRQVYSCALTP